MFWNKNKLNKADRLADALRSNSRHDRHFHHHHHHHQHIYGNLTSLSIVPVGEYIFAKTLCDPEMEYRLLEMGFVPGAPIKVISKDGLNGESAVMVEIKGSNLALNGRIANDILVADKKEVFDHHHDHHDRS
ncbi:MAG: ferrous iron transport protein A [Elusimicrobiota bacterium]|jgi:Fe2+ transport system protein FeoA|nr:ferrous iron transport protein A [Elusimicrobiota bacterium]